MRKVVVYNENYKGHKINIEKEKIMSKMTKTIAALGVVAGLGVAAMPLSSYAAEVSNTGASQAAVDVTVSATVGNSISITASEGTVSLGSGNIIANQDVAEGSTDVTISTNNAQGYQLRIKDKDSTLALMPAADGTATGIAAGVPAKGTNAWGYKASSTADGVSVDITDYTAIKATNQQIAEKSSASAADGDTITVTFGVTIDSTILPDTYSDVVTLTAVSNS